MKIVICEDEKVYSDLLIERIEKYFSEHEVCTEITVFQDAQSLMESLIKGNSYDIIFLDIQLGKSDGMETAALIRKTDRKTTIIFVTGLENRAVEGYSVAAYDYIVKSTLDDRIEKVLSRFLNDYNHGVISLTLNNDETVIVYANDILWIESDGRGSVVGTADRQFSSASSVSKIVPLLPKNMFTEIYLSVFVQTGKIKNIGNDSVEMDGGKILPMSRRKRKCVMSAVMKAVRGGVSCRAKDIH